MKICVNFVEKKWYFFILRPNNASNNEIDQSDQKTLISLIKFCVLIITWTLECLWYVLLFLISSIKSFVYTCFINTDVLLHQYVHNVSKQSWILVEDCQIHDQSDHESDHQTWAQSRVWSRVWSGEFVIRLKFSLWNIYSQ